MREGVCASKNIFENASTVCESIKAPARKPRRSKESSTLDMALHLITEEQKTEEEIVNESGLLKTTDVVSFVVKS